MGKDRKAAEKLGERIRSLREAIGMSQKELSDALDVDPAMVSRLEIGQSSTSETGKTRDANPTFELLSRIADKLKVPIQELFEEPKKVGQTHRELMSKDLIARLDRLEPGELNPIYALVVRLTEGRYTHLLGFNRKPVPPLKEK